MIFFRHLHGASTSFQKPRYRRMLPGERDRQSRISWLVSRVMFYILLVLFLGVAVYIFLFSPFLKINTIAIQGINELPYEKIMESASSLLEGKYLGILDRDNLLLISRKKVAGILLDNFKKIRSVEVKKIFPDTLKITVNERKSLVILYAGGPGYLLDEQGYAYAGADLGSREVTENNLVQIIDESAKPVTLGEKILSEEYVNFIAGIREKLDRGAGISIANEYHMPSRVAEEIRVKTGEGWDLYLSSNILPDKSIRMLNTFLEEEIKNVPREKIEYVDLRAEDKIYYKLRSDEEKKEDENTEEQGLKPEKDKDKKDKR